MYSAVPVAAMKRKRVSNLTRRYDGGRQILLDREPVPEPNSDGSQHCEDGADHPKFSAEPNWRRRLIYQMNSLSQAHYL